jgi:general secretion pathway protein J
MIMSGTPERAAGFTLLELLVGLTLLGFVGVLMLTGYQVAVKAWQGIDQRGHAAQELQLVQDFLRQRLSQTYPAFTGDQPGSRMIDFAGQPDSLEFLAPLPLRFGAADIVRYQLKVADHALQLVWRMDRPEPQRPSPFPTILLDNVAVASFAYFGGTEVDATPRWQTSWMERRELPRLIRIRLVRADGRFSDWPDLIVPLRLTAGVECNFDLVDARCRNQ